MMAANIKILKLITGEELIAEILEDKKENIKFKNPLRVVLMPSRTDPKNPAIGLAPWAEFCDEKSFTLDKKHVLLVSSPIQEFVNQYNSVYGGIVAPSSKLIIPGS